MGRWVKISIEDVASYQAGALIKALESKAKYSDAQENPLESAIKRITARIRSDVKSGGYAVDKAQDKIPGELSGEAVALIVEFRQNRGGQDKPVASRRSRSRGGIRTGKRRLPACAPRARSSAAQRLQRTLRNAKCRSQSFFRSPSGIAL